MPTIKNTTHNITTTTITGIMTLVLLFPIAVVELDIPPVPTASVLVLVRLFGAVVMMVFCGQVALVLKNITSARYTISLMTNSRVTD